MNMTNSQLRSSLIATAITAALIFSFVSPVHAATLTRQLEEGMSGADVSTLQAYLAQDPSIYPQGLVTGYYGFLTKSAVANYQSQVGLPSVGRVGPATMAALNIAMSGSPTQMSGDVSAPMLGAETLVTSMTAATIAWSTDEAANSRVMYSTSRPFLYASAWSAASANGLSATANVTITGLQPHTTYYYTIESTDTSGNMSLTLQKSFMTQ